MRREVTAVVKKCRKGDGKKGKPWCLYTKDGSRLLGAHKSKQDAYKQEAAIKHSQGSFAAVLDAVADELEQRRAFRLAAAVDRVTAGLADLVDEEIEDELNEMGFTSDVLTRREDVAEEIYEERIPNIDLVTYYDNP